MCIDTASVQIPKRAPAVLGGRPAPRARRETSAGVALTTRALGPARPARAGRASTTAWAPGGRVPLGAARVHTGPRAPRDEREGGRAARRTPRVPHAAQGVTRTLAGGSPPGRAARLGDSSRAEETPPPDAARRSRDARAARAVPAREPEHAGVAPMRAKPGRLLLAGTCAGALPPGLVFGACFWQRQSFASCSRGRPRTCLPVVSTPAV